MTTQQFFLYGWSRDPVALAFCAGMLAGYFLVRRRIKASANQRVFGRANQFYGISGLALLVLVLLSPLGTLARSYLFSAHMLQHLVLLLIVPPLLLLSVPRSHSSHCLTPMPRFQRSGSPLSWLAGVGAMWLWHVPVLCNAATSSAPIYWLQTVSLLLLGMLFWWPIAGPRTDQHLSPLAGIGYLVSACLACTVLGIYITFAPLSVCSIYTQPVDQLGLLPLIQQRWGLTPSLDQHLGGLLMWVPACLIYLSGVLGLLIRWFSNAEATEIQERLPGGVKGVEADA